MRRPRFAMSTRFRFFGLALLLLGASGLPLNPARAQLSAVTPGEQIVAGQRVNAFVEWGGAAEIGGLELTLPAGWSLRDASAFRVGTAAQVGLRIEEGPGGRLAVVAARPLRGAHRFILGVQVAERPGLATVELAPIAPGPEGERGARLPAWARSWRVFLTEAPADGGGRSFHRRPGGEPVALDRRALPPLNASDPFTLEFWMLTTGLDEVILSTWDGRDTQTYPLELVVGPRGDLQFYRGGPSRHESMSSEAPVADGRWHHVALVQEPERGVTRLLIDGAVVDSLRGAPNRGRVRSGLTNNALPLSLGGRRAAPDGEPAGPYTGYLDEFRLWSRARTPREIARTMRDQFTAPVEGVFRLGFEGPVGARYLAREVEGDIQAPSNLAFAAPIDRLAAVTEGEIVRIEWETRDRRSARFVVERSTDGATFRAIGAVRPEERIAEAADGTMRFAYTDGAPPGPLLFYRIRQEIADGADRLSSAVKVGAGAEDPEADPDGVGAIPLTNAPNPFRSRTRIQFRIERAQPVELSVWDAAGQRVAVLINEDLRAGTHERLFDAEGLASGAYLARLRTPEASATRRMVLVR